MWGADKDDYSWPQTFFGSFFQQDGSNATTRAPLSFRSMIVALTWDVQYSRLNPL